MPQPPAWSIRLLTRPGTDYEWNDLGIVLLFILAGVLLSIFTYFQWVKQDLGTIPPRIIRKRSILAGAFFSLCTSAALVVMTYYVSTGKSPPPPSLH